MIIFLLVILINPKNNIRILKKLCFGQDFVPRIFQYVLSVQLLNLRGSLSMYLLMVRNPDDFVSETRQMYDTNQGKDRDHCTQLDTEGGLALMMTEPQSSLC